MFEKLVPYDIAYTILEAYIGYYRQYKRITKRAKIRFEHRDWRGLQADAGDRSLLYRDVVGHTVEELRELLGPRLGDAELWRETKHCFFEEVANFNTRNIAETFYNSVFRHAHHSIGMGADSELMFVHASGTYREFRSMIPIYHTIYLSGSLDLSMRHLIHSYHFDVPYADLERDLGFITRRLQTWLDENALPGLPVRIEILKSIFFRNKFAYLVGRICQQEKPTPFLLAIHHADDGLFFDALLLEADQVSTIFSYNRSYFLVDVDIVTDTVDFLRSIIPVKSMGELYNSIGFEKHGKTVFYRDFVRHLEYSQEFFIPAPGTPGMVMTVFTLPSYNMVFKVIKDRFAPPKSTTEDEVKEKYELVNRHDRVGRMVDSYLFENLTFNRRRFTQELLHELQRDCGNKVIMAEETVTIRHLYVEKKMMPLNLFLQNASERDVVHALDEYGIAIKQLAAVNIFPGDMLLKNFGVTRLGRVIFYDYDEIGFLTDYRFRAIPKPRDVYEEMSAEPYFYVRENDIFPEEFPKFLFTDPHLLATFNAMHGEIFTPQFWCDVQRRLKSGELVDVLPYRPHLRFQNMFLSPSPAAIAE